jgi:hypothetical protein
MKDGHFSRAADAVICLLLSTSSVLLYRKIVRLWWMFDDPFLINLLRGTSILGVFHDRGLHRQIGRPLFGPLLFLSLKLDLQLFGLSSQAFYVHQLVAFALLPPLLYLLLRLWCPIVPSAFAAAVAMAAGPMTDVVPQLMLRHYIEGAAFAVAAVTLFVLAVRHASWRLAIASALLYFLAASAKEVYVPMLALLPVIPEGALWRRLRLTTPHLVAAAAYTIWRLMVVGFGLGPFGFVVPRGRMLQLILGLPFRATREFAGSGSTAGWALLTAVVVSAAIVVIRLPSARLVALVGLAVALLPIVPVAGEMQPRWTLTLWLLASLSIGFLSQALPRYGTALAGIVLVLAAIAWRVEWPMAYRRFLRMSDESRVFAALSRQDILRDPASPPATMPELARLTGSQARAFYDDLLLCEPSYHVNRIFEYDPSRREVLEASRASLVHSCAAIRKMPLEFTLRFEPDGAFYWTAGPYRDGKWAFVLWEGLAAYEVPREGGFRAPGFEHFDLRVRYTSPSGWKTYSQMLKVDSHNGRLVYRQ